MREYEAEYGSGEVAKEDRALLRQQYAEIKAELNLLWSEQNQAYQVGCLKSPYLVIILQCIH